MKVGLVAPLVALVCSGAAALLYESAWTRMLHRLFGVSDLAVATVLACFFLGLGLGSAIAARYADRVSRPAVAYAVLEVGVALYAVASLAFVPELHRVYATFGQGASFGALTSFRLFIAAATLLPPTIAMGATLPFLATLVRAEGRWAAGVTSLYIANTLGAVAGAAAAGFWLIPQHGTRAAVIAAAVLGVVAAGIAIALLPRTPRATLDHTAPSDGPSTRAPTLRLELVLTAMSGGVALASEVMWTRVLRIVVHGTTAAFAAMLVNYLLGVAIGSLLARRIARSGRAGVAFGVLQLSTAVAIVGAIALAPHLPRIIPLLTGTPNLVPHDTSTLLVVSALLLLPLAIITGTGLPLTWAMAAERSPDVGATSGKLLAANTAGGLVGSLLAGFVLVPLLGIEASLLGVAAVAALASAIALRSSLDGGVVIRVAAATGPFVVLVGLVATGPTLSLPFLLSAAEQPVRAVIEGPGQGWRENIVFLREGRNTTVTLRGTPGSLVLHNDGRPESGFGAGDPGFGAELVLLGALPGLFAEEREQALVVGLGAGHTTTLALAGGFQRVIAVELEEAVVEAARVLHQARNKPFPLDDPRAELVVDDARNRIALTPDASLDAVVSQPSHPWLAGSSALYTEEFHRDVERALRPGGVFAIWINLFRMDVENIRSVLGTLTSVFPHALGFVVDSTSLVLVASETELDWARAAERMAEASLSRYLTPVGLATLPQLVAKLELDASSARALGRGAEPIVDDRPLLEFRLAGLLDGQRVTVRDLDRALDGHPWLAADSSVARMPDLARAISARIGAVSARPRALTSVERTLGTLGVDGDARAMLEGRLADARGDVRSALAAYDRAGTADAEALGDRIRLDEGMHDALLRRARSRATQPTEAAPVISAALTIDTPEALETARAVASQTAYPPESALRDVLDSYTSGGCGGLLEHAALLRVAETNAAAARVGARCALGAGEIERAERLITAAATARHRRAELWTGLGRDAFAGGNGGLAWVALRRALRLQPASPVAVGTLARLHARDGRAELARDELSRGYTAAEGDDDAREQIAAVARQLGLDIGAGAGATRP